MGKGDNRRSLKMKQRISRRKKKAREARVAEAVRAERRGRK